MLHDIKIQEDIGKTPDQLHSQFEGLKKFFEKHHNLQKALGKDAAYSPNIHHGKIDEMIREARNGLRNFDDTIRR